MFLHVQQVMPPNGYICNFKNCTNYSLAIYWMTLIPSVNSYQVSGFFVQWYPLQTVWTKTRYLLLHNLATMQANLSLEFPTKQDLNQSLLTCRYLLEKLNFTCSKFRCDTIQKKNIKGADQCAWMHKLVFFFVVCKPQQTFSRVNAYMGKDTRFWYLSHLAPRL